MKYHMVLLIDVSLFFACICPLAETEVYTAIANMGQLLRTYSEVVNVLNTYLEVEGERLETVRWFKNQYEKLYNTAMQDEESFLTNPINAFMLLKRLSKDWKFAGYLIEGEPSRDLVRNLSFMDLPFPDEEDLNGAAVALLRLQDTYLLDTAQLARGEITGAKSRSSELTAGDCIVLGQQATTLGNCKRATQWAKEALVKLEREEIKTTSKPFVLEIFAHCAFKLKNLKRAIKITRHIIATAPEHPRAADNLIHYERILNTEDDTVISEEEFDVNSFDYSDYEDPDEYDPYSLRAYKRYHATEFDKYEQLCRGEGVVSHRMDSQLKCQYTTNDNSYLLLQPVKQEILSLDPFICIYHDVLSEKDVEFFKEISLPRLKRAVVSNPETGEEEKHFDRVSKSTWLEDSLHPRVAHASEIAKRITGLETNTAEQLHVINYGIGGHYEPHYDFKREGEADAFAHLGTGNRIATWIYYLSDVDAGGATVFPKVGVSVKPRKGSATFWYNLRKSGDGDLNTLHAGCPVLTGSKWVGNKWFHEVNNEFRRKCSLDRRE